MRYRSILAACALLAPAAWAQGSNEALANVPKLLQVLNSNGFDVREGQFRILDPPPMACIGVIPSTWFNNVQPYMSVILPGAADDPVPWEKTKRMLFPSFLFRQDEALVMVGSTPIPMAYFGVQTFQFGRYNPKSYTYDPATGGFFRPYDFTFAYLGDTVNSLTIRTTGNHPFNRPMAFISTGNHRTQERIRAALRASGYPDAIINTETLPASMVRFGYENADQLLLLLRVAIAEGGDAVMNQFEQSVVDGKVLRVFRVRPKNEFPADPLPEPVLRVRGTGRTEMAMYPTMEKLREQILAAHAAAYTAEELDTFFPDGPGAFPEGYPAVQRGVAYQGIGKDGSAGYGRHANYRVSSWFELPENGFALVYGVDHAATGKASYSSLSVYLDKMLAAGFAGADSADFRAHPNTARQYLPGEPGIEKFYVWKVARHCNGDPRCSEATVPAAKMAACGGKIAADAPVRIAFRSYAEPATQVGPSDPEILYEHVIVSRPK